MVDQSSVSDVALAGRERVRLVLQGLLRGAQASGWTDESLSGACGVPARTIKSYRVDGKEPCLTNALSLAVVLGKTAINAILAIIGYGGATPLDEADDINVNEMVASGLRHFTTIATAAADGRIDHSEEPDCTAAADQIIATFLPLSSSARAV